MTTNNFRRYMLATVLWKLACEHDAIGPGYFAVFSASNPWARKLNALDEPTSDVFGMRPELVADLAASEAHVEPGSNDPENPKGTEYD